MAEIVRRVRDAQGREMTLRGDHEPTDAEIEEGFLLKYPDWQPAGGSGVSPPPPPPSASTVSPPPPPPDDIAEGFGPPQPGAKISSTPFMQKSITDLLGMGPGLDATEDVSGSAGKALIRTIRRPTLLGVMEEGPAIMGTALGMAGFAVGGWIPAVALAALGGAGGLGIKRAGQAAAGVPIVDQDLVGRVLWPKGIPASIEGDFAEMFGEELKQGFAEGIGHFGSWALRRGARPEGILALADDLGLPRAAKTLRERISRNTITGEGLANRALRSGQAKALERATPEAAALGGPPPVPEDSALKYIAETQKAFKVTLQEAGDEAVVKGLSRAEGETGAFIMEIAPELDPISVVGRRAQGAAERGAHLARRGPGGANELYTRADELNEGATIDITDHIQSLKKMVEEAMLSPTADPTALVQYTRKLAEVAPDLVEGGISGEASALLANVSAANREGLEKALAQTLGGAEGPVTLPYAQSRELQKWLGQRMLPKKQSANIAEGRVREMWWTLKNSMNRSTEGTQGGAALAEANRFYENLKDVVDKSAVSRLVEGYEKNPEKVLQVMSGGPSNVRYLRRAIVGFAEKHGGLKEQAAANEVWGQMGRLFAEEKLLLGGIKEFPDKIASATMRETLTALYGREMADNFQRIASSVRALKTAGPAVPSEVQRGALKRLDELDQALRSVGKVSEGGGVGAYRFGAGSSLPVRLLAGARLAVATGGTVEVMGGLTVWAASNRARMRHFQDAAAEGFRVRGPATLRLINAYLDYQRDMALIEARRQEGGPPEPGTTVEMSPEKLDAPTLGPPPEPAPGPPPPPPGGSLFKFLN